MFKLLQQLTRVYHNINRTGYDPKDEQTKLVRTEMEKLLALLDPVTGKKIPEKE